MALLIMLQSLGFFDQFPPGQARAVLCSFLLCGGFYLLRQGIEALEIFAGASVVTRVLRSTGLRTAALDLEYWPAYQARKKRRGQKPCKSNLFDLSSACGFITAVLAVLACDPASHIVVLAVVCSSWVSISRGTTKRAFLDPLGDPSVASVKMGNLLASRQGIFCLLVCKGGPAMRFLSNRWFRWQAGVTHLPDPCSRGSVLGRTTGIFAAVSAPQIAAHRSLSQGRAI